jgi:hypothetical protein
MTLCDETGRQGLWLFRWRSHLPIALLALQFPASLLDLHWPFGSYKFHVRWEFACLSLSFLGLAIRAATTALRLSSVKRRRGFCCFLRDLRASVVKFCMAKSPRLNSPAAPLKRYLYK